MKLARQRQRARLIFETGITIALSFAYPAGVPLLRFSAWQRSSEHAPLPVRSWSGRATPANQTQDTPDGVALEHMIQLANAVR